MELTMMELQNKFGMAIKKIEATDKDATPEERQMAIESSALIMNIGKQMINNADLVLRAEKLFAQTNALTNSRIERLIGE